MFQPIALLKPDPRFNTDAAAASKILNRMLQVFTHIMQYSNMLEIWYRFCNCKVSTMKIICIVF